MKQKGHLKRVRQKSKGALVQKRNQSDTKKFIIDEEALDLQHDKESIYICKNRIQGAFPVYITKALPFDEEILFTGFKQTLHREVGNI